MTYEHIILLQLVANLMLTVWVLILIADRKHLRWVVKLLEEQLDADEATRTMWI